MNSKVLELAGITKESSDPPGGIIRRDDSGEPNGVLEENALFAVLPTLLGKIDREGFKAMAVAGSELWASYGYTTADEGRATPGSGGC